MATNSVPAHWLTDDAMLSTLIDVLDTNAKRAAKRRRR